MGAGSIAASAPRQPVLCVVLAGTFMAILDVAIVNAAIPSISRDLVPLLGRHG